MFALFSLVCCSMTRCKSVICMSKSQWQTGLHSVGAWLGALEGEEEGPFVGWGVGGSSTGRDGRGLGWLRTRRNRGVLRW